MEETEENSISIRVFKHDATEYRRWKAQLVRQEESLLVFNAEFDADVSHELLGEIRKGTRTIEYYWLDRWYNVFQFLNADGSTRLWYCNINTPPKLEGAVLTYVDLDIDILVRPDYSYQVMDLDEFEENTIRYGYSDKETAHARMAMAELVSLIERRQFPFSVSASSVSSVVHV